MHNLLNFVELELTTTKVKEPMYKEYLDYWLKENCEGWVKSSWFSVQIGLNEQRARILVAFSDEKEAAHFKLVWG